jgi:hypothetical protein
MSHRFDPRPGILSVLALTSVGSLALFSCAKVDTAGPGSGGNTGTGSGGNSGTGSMTGTGNSTGSGGGTPSRNDGGLIIADMNVGVCQEGNYKYVPQIPTVYVMVDRSGSMFDCISTPSSVEPSCPNMADTPWTKLKEGVLTVVKALQSEVRFGFASFTGTNPRLGGMCPMIDKEPPKLDNHDAIKARYDGLAFGPNTTESGKKFETPASQSLGLIGADLLADTTEGAKYILYVTDGEPDYCGDGNVLCPPDGVVGALQKLKTAGITTIVLGIKSAIAQDLPVGVLEAFANAGAGEPTVAPLRGTNPKIEDLYDQCYNPGATADEAPGGWTRELVATGKPLMRGQTIGTYSATAGPTLPYRPDVANQTMLINQLSQALSGVKSCTFNLNNLDGNMLKIDATQLEKVSVSVQGTAVALDMTNGWKLNGTSELELTGSACANWRMPMNNDIKIQIPCAVIIVE